MQKKLQATAELLAPGVWSVIVTNADTGEVETLEIEAVAEKDAAFKAMEQINDQ